jgi:hypothetical protein
VQNLDKELFIFPKRSTPADNLEKGGEMEGKRGKSNWTWTWTWSEEYTQKKKILGRRIRRIREMSFRPLGEYGDDINLHLSWLIIDPN